MRQEDARVLKEYTDSDGEKAEVYLIRRKPEDPEIWKYDIGEYAWHVW